MGTNFYKRYIPTEDDVQKINELTSKKMFEVLQEYVYQMNEQIHIGKRSGGWQFCFNHHKAKYFDPSNKENLIQWLQEPGYEIVDEYGDKLSFDEFWNMVTGWNADPNNNWDDEAYYKWENKENGLNLYHMESDYSTKDEIERLFGIRPKYHDFFLDGLRYSTGIEFC